jgi:hypothetical protein
VILEAGGYGVCGSHLRLHQLLAACDPTGGKRATSLSAEFDRKLTAGIERNIGTRSMRRNNEVDSEKVIQSLVERY